MRPVAAPCQWSFPLWLLLSLLPYNGCSGPTTLALAKETVGKAEPSKKCESLKTSLTYSQEKAPRDISGVLPVVVEKMNRELDGVVDVEVEWTGGELHRRVGSHIVQCSVTRLLSAVKPDKVLPEHIFTDDEGREVIAQCFHVPFTISDTDECALPPGHAMRHKCHASTLCVNTLGSYECLCPLGAGGGEGSHHAPAVGDEEFWKTVAAQHRGPWELSLNSTTESSCPSKPSTHNCCPEYGHSAEGSTCRAAFRCPVDPCSSKKNNDCAPNARCRRAASPLDKPNYECQCPPGLMGNGHACRKGIDPKPQPKVMYDGVTPTEETVKNRYYCGCTKPVVDACAGFPPCKGKHEICVVTANNTPKCACEPGFVDNQDGYGCVDETPPILRLRHDPDGDGINRLQQGDVYKEYAVDIIDDNAEDYLRSLKITYSKPLPPGCLTKMGRFHVNYTVATPWTSPPYVRVTRTVIIEDVDECSLDVERYAASCPELVPKCDTAAGAKCVNTIGSYMCKCPKYTTGDGFKSISTLEPDNIGNFGPDAPEGYKGGTGCRDTSRPVIELRGPNPKVFKVCKCGGLSGTMHRRDLDDGDDMEELRREQRKSYEGDIKEMIQTTSGAELCATHMYPNPRPGDCVNATDHTYRGPVDLTSRVVIGAPVQKSLLRWSVPYNVIDDAGNEAKTVWREIVVEEVDLYELENRIRMEVVAEKDAEIRNAVEKALQEERRKAEQIEAVPTEASSKNAGARGRARTRSTTRGVSTECPPCPECVCSASGGDFDVSLCDPICEQKMKDMAYTCPAQDGSRSRDIAERVMAVPAAIPKDGLTSPFLCILHWLESIFPPWLILSFLLCSTMAVIFFILKRVLAAIFNSREDVYYYTRADEERERAMRDAVTYYRSPGSSSTSGSFAGAGGNAGSASSAPPRASMSLGGQAGNGIFSPQEHRLYGQERVVNSPLFSPTETGTDRTGNTPPSSQSRREDGDNIYQTMSPITPARSNGTPASNTSSTPYNLRRRY